MALAVLKLPLLALLLAAALDSTLLAPGPGDLQAQAAALRTHLEEADAIGGALARIHNTLAEGPAPKGADALCARAESRSLLARTRPFGAAYRDRVQSARAAADRLRRILAAPTVEPVVGRGQRAQLDALLSRVEAHERRYAELSAWQTTWVEPALRRCAPQLEPGRGLPGARTDRTAILATGGGRVCPAGIPADGRVIVLEKPLACWSSHACSCAPMPISPGAVLGP